MSESQSLAILLEQDVNEQVKAGTPIDFRGLLTAAFKRLKNEVVANIEMEPLVAAVERLYDLHVAPIDLPTIPNFIEPAVDRAIRNAIRPTLHHMLDLLVKS